MINKLESEIRSALLGLAVGDALGVPVEFTSRQNRQRDPVMGMRAYGTHHQPAGTWSDDASLTFCLAEALAEKLYSVRQLADNCVRWVEEGFWTPQGRVFDIGITTREALNKLKKQGKNASPLVGGKDEMSNGNGALMRILPLAFYHSGHDLQARFQLIREASAITHGHVRSAIASFLYLEMAGHTRQGLAPPAAYARLCAQAPAQLAELSIAEKELAHFQRILGGELMNLPESAIASSGYVVHTLEAAFWCLLKYDTYAATVLAAVNLGEDTDTTGAVVGGLAGICYGEKAIPAAWLDVLVRRTDIEHLAHRMAQACAPASLPRPIPNSYWATEQVLGAEYPGDKDLVKAKAKITALLAAGITDFYDLTEAHELTSYEPLLEELASAKGIDITYQRYPIKDVDVPDSATLEAVLSALADTVHAGRKAAVHCWGGVGRTGTILGCYLVRAQNLSGSQALARIAQEWQGVEKQNRKPNSPETAAQCRMVETFE
ncbi:MAG TPA: ADP-ribosylglycohydrolase family protein [Hymenobacter sp.]|jgi:ADP-ribosylglycohydrolase|uniref:ADP-ribosylglycohydrolase family protein n=1 Tax=Hymenobacter sp. TaxID=1898978 RepID=UPI002EDA7823